MPNNVKQIRKQKGLTQAQVVALSGGTFPQGDLSKIETGWMPRPSKRLKTEIAKALGVSEDELFPKL